MHFKPIPTTFALSLLATIILAVPSPAPTPPAKRQIDPVLLSLASAVGLTTLPTDPAKLSTISLLVGGITSQLPPSPILSVLETAVPSSLISELGSNPESLATFASQFSAGSTPGWYSSLPGSVKSFFRTYSANFAELGSAERSITSVLDAAASSTSGSASRATQMVSVETTTATETVTTTTGAPQGTGSQGGAVGRVTVGLGASLAGAVGLLGVVIGL